MAIDLKDSIQLDEASRKAIFTDLNHNFIVEAGAGSGKTFSLVRRLVAMVEQGVDVSTISCITFTKAAAGEFYERFQNLLSVRSRIDAESDNDLGVVTKESAALCQKALSNIDLCFMGTIDAFIQKLINEHPYDFHVPSNVPVVDGDTFNKIIERECLNILNGEYDEEDPSLSEYAKKVLVYLGGFSNYVKAVQDLYPHHAQNIVIPEVVSDINLDEKYKDEKRTLVDDLSNAAMILKDLDLSGLSKAALKQIKFLSYSWNIYLSKVIDALDKLKKLGVTKAKLQDRSLPPIFVPKECDGTSKSYIIDKKYTETLLDQLEEIRYAYVMPLFTRSIKVISNHFKKLGIATYSDFIINLRDALKEDAKLGGKIIKFIQRKRQRYLLDEFQDTNPLQTEIFFYLTASTPNEDYHNCSPIPGSLFIVGDPKQSIYRFNGADIDAFLEVEKLFEKDPGGKVLYLTQNFRSNIALKQYFNATMEDTLMVSGTSSDSHYIKIPELGDLTKEKEATLNGAYYYEYDATDKAEDGYTPLVRLIKDIVNNKNYTICVNGEIRKVNYQDIMVIFKAKNAISKVTPYFFNNDIPFMTEGALAFESSTALEEIKVLFKAICKPNDLEAVYQALLTPFVGLEENEIVALLNIDNKLDISSNVEFTVDKTINARFNKLVDLYNACKNLSFSAKFLYLVENTDLYLRHDNKFMEYVFYAYEVLKSHVNDHTVISSDEAIQLVESFVSGNENYERCLSLSPRELDVSLTGGKVKIANLHKTKGLEAPIIILASLRYKGGHKPCTRVEREPSGTNCYIFKLINDYERPTCSTKLYGCFEKDKESGKYKEELVSIEEEKRRTLYVGATRAISALFIAQGTGYTKTDGWKHKECYWDALLPVGNEVIEFKPDESFGEKYTNEGEKVSVNDLYKKEIPQIDKSSSFHLQRPSKLKIKPLAEEEDTNDDVINISEAWLANKEDALKEEAAIAGTLVHRFMEVLVNSHNKCDKKILIDKILGEYGLLTDEYRKILTNVSEHITSGGFSQKDSLPDDILGVLLSSKKVLTEVPFSYMDGDKLYRGVMDVIYLDQNDKWHIIDYKTNKEEDIEKLEDEYAAQLLSYKEAFKHITNEEADAHIYHIVC